MFTRSISPSFRFLITSLATTGLTAAGQAQSSSPTPTPSSIAAGEHPVQLDDLVVYGRSLDLTTQAGSAAEGQVGSAELAARPFLRRGELLEVVPGLVVTQHSGSGKANQYFLRGFNLDHGTDFAVTVDGLPVNMRSHAHGQGYADVNFIIPELIESVRYQKGAFFAENGDFSAAGAAQFHLVDSLPQGFAKVEVGQDNSYRAVVAETVRPTGASNPVASTTVAAEASYYDGPWEKPEASRRLNAFARHSWKSGASDYALTALAYDARWTSTDQIPASAIASGQIGRFGTLDPSDGGDANRVSLSLDRTHAAPDAATALNLFVLYNRLDLYSNFTHFAQDPINGDQFNQREDRVVVGGSAKKTWHGELAGRDLKTTLGVQLRDDFIDVALRHTDDRALVAPVRQDDIQVASAGLFVESTYPIAPWLRAEVGARGDFYAFDVEGGVPANSGDETAALFTPKLGLVFGPWAKTELYANAGLGFHSNDARGVTDPAAPATPLAGAKNAELGLRTSALPGLVSTVSLWSLDLDSELVFVGDEGVTEASGPTHRHGVEFANFYRATSWLALDADVAFTQARFIAVPAGQDRIPNSIGTVVTGGVVVDLPTGWFGAFRGRYFGPQPLIEDNSVTAPATITYHARLGWRGGSWEVALDVLNLFDRANNDIAYYSDGYRVTPTAALERGLVLHPAEPRTFRVSAMRRF